MNELAAGDLAWLVGFYEGEGCVTIRYNAPRRHVAVRVKFTQKDLEPLQKVRDILGISGSLEKNRDGCHNLTYWSAQAREILQLMKPYLSARRQGQIAKALDGWRYRPEKGRNRRGGSVNSPGQMRLL